MNTQELIDAIRQWGIDKGITGPSGKGTLLGQLAKTQEELTETRDAAVWLECVRAYNALPDEESAIDELEDGLGDTFITLVLAAEMAGTTIEACAARAYGVISKRTGRMENGQFVKDA